MQLSRRKSTWFTLLIVSFLFGAGTVRAEQTITFPDEFVVPYSHFVMLNPSDMYYSEWINPATTADRRSSIWNDRATTENKATASHERVLSGFLESLNQNSCNARMLYELYSTTSTNHCADPVSYENNILNHGLSPSHNAPLSVMTAPGKTIFELANSQWIEMCSINLYTRCESADSCALSHYSCITYWEATNFYPTIPDELKYLFTYPVPSCSGGTPYGSCASPGPNYCDKGTLVHDSGKCGCPAGTMPDSEKKECVSDSDGDSVSDSSDLCPGTPLGTSVTLAGCPATTALTGSVAYNQIATGTFEECSSVKFKLFGMVELFDTAKVHHASPLPGLYAEIYDPVSNSQSPWLKVGDSYLLSSGVSVTITAINRGTVSSTGRDSSGGLCDTSNTGDVCEIRYESPDSTISYQLSTKINSTCAPAGCSSDQCSISAVCYNAGQDNPSNSCQSCDLSAPGSWSNKACGVSCAGGVCGSGSCQSTEFKCVDGCTLVSPGSACPSSGTCLCSGASCTCRAGGAEAAATIARVPVSIVPNLLTVSGVVSVNAGKEDCLAETCGLPGVVRCAQSGSKYYAKFIPQDVPVGGLLDVQYAKHEGCTDSDYTVGAIRYKLRV